MSIKTGLEALWKHSLFPAFLVLSVILWYVFNLYVSKSQLGSIVLGGLLVFLVPGYSWGLTLARDSAGLERFVISVVLSVSLVILSLLAMNLALRIPLNRTTVLWDIVLISIAGLARWRFAHPTKK